MSYSTISLSDVMDWTDAHETRSRDKFVLMIMSVGADRVQMVRTEDKSFCVITHPNQELEPPANPARFTSLSGSPVTPGTTIFDLGLAFIRDTG